MAKRTTGLDEPPKRPARGTSTNMDGPRIQDDTELVPMSHKLPRGQVKYLRMLAIHTGKDQRDLLSEAVAMLQKKYGDV